MAYFETTNTDLKELLNDITRGKIQLPDFQRGWVWNDEHIRSLLNSIARSFPVGAVMLLEAGGETRFKIRPVEGVSHCESEAERLILDGQQRLTSLTQVLMLEKPVKTKDQKGRELDRYYYIDIAVALEGPSRYEDAIFGVDADKKVKENFGKDIKLDLSTIEKECESFMFPFTSIYDSSKWEMALHKCNNSRFDEYFQFRAAIIERFKEYKVPVITLNKDNKKEAVCLVFEKVNRGGVPLTVFELITATFAAEDVNLRDEWYGDKKNNVEGIRSRLSRQPMLRGIEPTDFFQAISLLYTFQRRQVDISNGRKGNDIAGVSAKREAVLSLPLSAYQDWKDNLCAGFWSAATFLRQQSFFSRNDLPYASQLVPLAAVLTHLGKRWQEQVILDKITQWFWCGVLGELYGGSVETRLALDLQELIAWIDDEGLPPSTVRDANFQPSRLDTLRSRNSAAYKGINVMIQKNGARDFYYKTTIRDLGETDWEESRLDVHHIFPKAWCEKNGIPASRYNSILNKTPISYVGNRKIGGRAPSEYIKYLESLPNLGLTSSQMDEILKSHFIDSAHIRNNDFERFISARRQALVEEISLRMGKAISEDSAQDNYDDEDDEPV